MHVIFENKVWYIINKNWAGTVLETYFKMILIYKKCMIKNQFLILSSIFCKIDCEKRFYRIKNAM